MTTTTHIHYWIIESPTPSKRVLQGACRIPGCGAVRGFNAAMLEYDDNAQGRKVIAERSRAWKAQATLLLANGEDVPSIVEKLGMSVTAVQRLKRRIDERGRGGIP